MERNQIKTVQGIPGWRGTRSKPSRAFLDGEEPDQNRTIVLRKYNRLSRKDLEILGYPLTTTLEVVQWWYSKGFGVDVAPGRIIFCCINTTPEIFCCINTTPEIFCC